MPDYTPRADKAEWHLSYRCDLSCPGCNRACFLPAQTPDMTLDDAGDFCAQAKALKWCPRIMIIGGEPTLHKDFFDFLGVAVDFTGDPQRVEVWSNGHSRLAQKRLDQVRRGGLAKVIEGTIKGGSVVHPVRDIFLAPCDFGGDRQPCGTHASITDPDCGISVDAGGYTVCCMGGAIDGVLGLGVRTKRLADLFDPKFAAEQTRALCANCGQHLGVEGKAEVYSYRGTPMSRTWHAAALRAEASGLVTIPQRNGAS
jgi:hypothetical protein